MAWDKNQGIKNDASYLEPRVTQLEKVQVTTIRKTLTLTADQDFVSVPIEVFNKDKDVLLVFVNSTYIELSQDYTISTNGDYIFKTSGVWESGSIFNFVVFKYVSESGNIVVTDGSQLADDSVMDRKLHPDNKVGSLSTLKTSYKSDVVGAINEHNDLMMSEFEDRGINVKEFGAKADGSDDTAAIQAALDSTQRVIFFPDETFHVSSLGVPAGKVLVFNNTKFVRNGGTGLFIDILDNVTTVGNLEIDGNKTNITGGKSERGLFIRGNHVNFLAAVYSHDHHGHGIYISGSDVDIYNPRSEGNGMTYDSAGGGEGDGIYISNCNNVRLINPFAANNSRTGIVVTTYPTNADNVSNIIIDNPIILDDNAYSGLNCEYASKVTVNGLRGRPAVTSSNSKNLLFKDCHVRSYYATGTEDIKVREFQCFPLGDQVQGFVLHGEYPDIDGLIFRDTATTYSSNTVSVDGGTSAKAKTKNIRIENGNNAFVGSGIWELSDVVVLKANNRTLIVNGRYPRNGLPLHFMGGKMISYNSHEPGTGWGFTGNNKKGDLVYSTDPTTNGGVMGWVCVADGDPGTWEPFGLMGAVKAAAQADSTAADVATLQADFNALLQKLRDAKLMN